MKTSSPVTEWQTQKSPKLLTNTHPDRCTIYEGMSLPWIHRSVSLRCTESASPQLPALLVHSWDPSSSPCRGRWCRATAAAHTGFSALYSYTAVLPGWRAEAGPGANLWPAPDTQTDASSGKTQHLWQRNARKTSYVAVASNKNFVTGAFISISKHCDNLSNLVWYNPELYAECRLHKATQTNT